ncbi:DUF4190 domain-containing protein [Heyndrickxia camelliae]|uniref:DUF4190 domain-containing protein n=1 Tax=Heyndrickxia camelliae TaxID=1707093 RepID=A0A2N3LG89_9BACI|nr:DUF4190 domain-containing protein [Heyndrickxia camelliae]PKR83619.1 hypothetical protein CWO92_17665 [Heyndrickxia camelliae]
MDEKGRTTNSKSVISLTLGILSIVIPFIGVVLGVIGIIYSRIGIKEIEETNENGRGLATSGFICSIIGIIIHLLWILFIILSIYMFTNVEFEVMDILQKN